MRHAFSLVELSIVLVIIGLLAGGILGGQALIRGAELRSVTSEQARYRTALFTFKDKYGMYPGDFSAATSVWGKDNTNCSGDTGSVATPGTCNGNGNGWIGTASTEMWRSWQHLALAGMVEGTYSGTSTVVNLAVPGTNVPRGRMSNTGWTWQGNIWGGGDGCDYPQADNRLVFGGPAANNITMGPVLSPDEAWNIDQKTDDGLPGMGKTLTWATGCLPGCTTGNTTAATYNLASTTKSCALIFLPGSWGN
jgi:prepilin-type N-terminal cleavage/methylation domain-containing protein